MILVIGHAMASADTVSELLLLSAAHVLRSRAEPGCISHEMGRDALQPLRLTFVERWADETALQVHFGAEASRAFAAALEQLCDAPPQKTVYQAEALDLAALLPAGR